MSPGPLSKVIKLVAEIKGWDPVQDRAKAVSLINGTLELLYRTEALMQLYFQANGCVIAQTFREPCRNGCISPNWFRGVVMPPMVRNIREIRADWVDYEITSEQVLPSCESSWYGLPMGNPRAGRPRAEQLPRRLLERDIPECVDGRRVTFRSEDCGDCGLPVGLRYLDFNGHEQREDVVLANTPVVTSYSVAEFLEIVFPERKGWMKVATEDGFDLGRYHPSVLVPWHEWFRLETAACALKFQWRGLQEPVPLVFDTDLVPFSDSPAWRLSIPAYENLDSMELTPAQVSGLARIYGQLAAVSNADMDAAKKNFSRRIEPTNTRAALGTGRAFAGQSRRGYGWPRGWR